MDAIRDVSKQEEVKQEEVKQEEVVEVKKPEVKEEVVKTILIKCSLTNVEIDGSPLFTARDANRVITCLKRWFRVSKRNYRVEQNQKIEKG